MCIFIDDDAGYIGRIMLHHNPWSSNGFKIQIVCIILAPTLICAGIYLTLKHVVRTVGPDLSHLKPRFYTWLFIPFDVFCLCLQAIGGGVDAAASSSSNVNENQLRVGNDIIIAGIVLQVVNLAVFGLLSVDFFWRAYRHFSGKRDSSSTTSTSSSTSGAEIWHSRRFRIFCAAMTGAYTGILIRCIYRWVLSSSQSLLYYRFYSHKLTDNDLGSQKWPVDGGEYLSISNRTRNLFNQESTQTNNNESTTSNPIMRNEILFIVLEGA